MFSGSDVESGILHAIALREHLLSTEADGARLDVYVNSAETWSLLC